MSGAVESPPLLLSRADVATLLGVPLRQLTWWVYAMRPRRRYTHFQLARLSGGPPREIAAPIKPIKDLQRTLATLLQRWYEAPPNVHGFVLGGSPLSNARWHQRKAWVLRIDLEDFFPSINFGRVRGMFMAHPFDFPSDVATLLAQICCHENQLPQGAPTSPIVSNLICRSLDAALARVARAERCHYTRYADDICISTDRSVFPAVFAMPASSGTPEIGEVILQIILSNGFSPNIRKTRLMRQTQRQRVTGLIVNESVNVSSDYVRSIRNLLYIWRRYGENDAEQAFDRKHPKLNRPSGPKPPSFRRIVHGRVQYVGSVKGWSNATYRRLAQNLQTVDPTFQPTTLITLHTQQKIRIYTEGSSDYSHLLAAQDYFHSRGEFGQLRLEATADAAAGSDNQLLEKCKGLALTHQRVPCVCVFDKDDDKMVRKAVGGGDFKDYGKRVAAVAIAPPPWRDQRVCIEMLYRDDDLRRRDENGRRLYLSSEFDTRTGHHQEERVHVTHPGGRTLVREEVIGLDDSKSLGLSKAAFAALVSAGKGNFVDIDFEGFRRTFELIQEATARILTSQP